MRKTTTFMAFLLGGLIGSVFALLYAPQSGNETRKQLYDEGAALRDSTMDSIHEVRESALAAIKDAQKRMELAAKESRDALKELKGIRQTVNIDDKKQEKQPTAN